MGIVNNAGQKIVSYDSFKEMSNTTDNFSLSRSNIDSIFYEVMKQGTLSPARFEVNFRLPEKTLNHIREIYGNENWDYRLYFSCETSNLPGRGVSTTPNRIYGPVRETVYEKLYSGDLSLTFRLDSEMWLRKLFTAWHDIIHITETGDFDYYDNYISDIEIYQYPTHQASTEPGNSVEVPADDPDLKPIYGLRITEAYPKSIGAIELGYGTRDTYNKQTIEFAYRKWEEIPADEL